MATVTGDAKATYEAMASVYDVFTAHYDDELWIGELLSALERNGLSGDRLLDVACGTGKSFLGMLDRGWEVTACDISPAMLERARAKVGEAVPLSVADMRRLPKIGEFNLVWALDDSINYLLGEDELLKALRGMRENLAPGGLLLFDVNTLVSYRSFFAETVVVERPGRRLVWRGQAARDAPPGSVCEAVLEEDRGPTKTHVHRQRHFPDAEIRSAVERAGLALVDVYGLYTDGILRQPLDEGAHTKAVYIAEPEQMLEEGERAVVPDEVGVVGVASRTEPPQNSRWVGIVPMPHLGHPLFTIRAGWWSAEANRAKP